jgi:hypothetical protein
MDRNHGPDRRRTRFAMSIDCTAFLPSAATVVNAALPSDFPPVGGGSPRGEGLRGRRSHVP